MILPQETTELVGVGLTQRSHPKDIKLKMRGRKAKKGVQRAGRKTSVTCSYKFSRRLKHIDVLQKKNSRSWDSKQGSLESDVLVEHVFRVFVALGVSQGDARN